MHNYLLTRFEAEVDIRTRTNFHDFMTNRFIIVFNRLRDLIRSSYSLLRRHCMHVRRNNSLSLDIYRVKITFREGTETRIFD